MPGKGDIAAGSLRNQLPPCVQRGNIEAKVVGAFKTRPVAATTE